MALLHNLITRDAHTPLTTYTPDDLHTLDESSRLRLQKHLQKLNNATQLSLIERALLSEHNRFLAKVNGD